MKLFKRGEYEDSAGSVLLETQPPTALYDKDSMTPTRIVTKPIDRTSLTHKMHLTNWTIRIQPSYALSTDLIPRKCSIVQFSVPSRSLVGPVGFLRGLARVLGTPLSR